MAELTIKDVTLEQFDEANRRIHASHEAGEDLAILLAEKWNASRHLHEWVESFIVRGIDPAHIYAAFSIGMEVGYQMRTVQEAEAKDATHHG